MVTQIGLLVNDIEKTGKAFSKFLGCEYPGWNWTDLLEKAQTRYLGKPSQETDVLSRRPNVDIELIEPDHNPSTWRHDLDQKGEGFHHVAFVIKGMKEKNTMLAANDMPLLQKGEYTGGRYAYHDATDTLKMVLELLEND